MNLSHAFRLDPIFANSQAICLTGAGGKSTVLFQLARELTQKPDSSIILTTTTHLGAWQTSLADHHIVAENLNDLQSLPLQGVTLVTGKIENGKTNSVNQAILNWLREKSKELNIPLLIEGDGSRQKPLKAAAAHEPSIPEFTDIVIAVAGLTALGKPLTEEFVHRSEIFSKLSGLQINQPITAATIIQMLTHPLGGLKNIPLHARRIILLNQADTPEQQSIGGSMAHNLLGHFDSVIVGSLNPVNVQTFEHCAGIILAAGESIRFGSPKQLLDWKGKPFVQHVAETALHAGLWPVQVVIGSHAAEIESTLSGLPVNIVYNSNYQQGQSSSIKAGINSLNHHIPAQFILPELLRTATHSNVRGSIGSAIFLLADQPQISVEVIRALVESHGKEMQSIVAPLVLEERRANPVLFDRVTFPDLLKLTGDIGGRGIFSNYKVEYLPWHDDRLLLDVDKPEDYRRLVEDATL